MVLAETNMIFLDKHLDEAFMDALFVHHIEQVGLSSIHTHDVYYVLQINNWLNENTKEYFVLDSTDPCTITIFFTSDVERAKFVDWYATLTKNPIKEFNLLSEFYFDQIISKEKQINVSWIPSNVPNKSIIEYSLNEIDEHQEKLFWIIKHCSGEIGNRVWIHDYGFLFEKTDLATMFKIKFGEESEIIDDKFFPVGAALSAAKKQVHQTAQVKNAQKFDPFDDYNRRKWFWSDDNTR